MRKECSLGKNLLVVFLLLMLTISITPLINHNLYSLPYTSAYIGNGLNLDSNIVIEQNGQTLEIDKSFMSISVDTSYINKTKKEIKSIVDTIMGTHTYIYVEKYLGQTMLGHCAVLIPLIKVDPKVDGLYYASTLTHELIHMKDFTTNERYCEYMTFVTLWEASAHYSGTTKDFLRRSATIVLIRCINRNDKYDATGLITNYLLTHNIYEITY